MHKITQSFKKMLTMKLTKELLIRLADIEELPIDQILDDYEKARKYESTFNTSFGKEIWENQKLRELIEKRIEEIKETQATLYNANLMEGWDINKKITLPELQKLLEESKK